MRRSLLVLATAATLTLVGSSSAQAATSCGQASGKAGSKTYIFATKITASGLGCSDAKKFWIAFATGPAGPAGTEKLRTSCKLKGGTKAEKKAAKKQGRAIYSCKNGSMSTTAWVIAGG